MVMFNILPGGSGGAMTMPMLMVIVSVVASFTFWLLLLLMLFRLILLSLFWFPLFETTPTRLKEANIMERKPKVLKPPPGIRLTNY